MADAHHVADAHGRAEVDVQPTRHQRKISDAEQLARIALAGQSQLALKQRAIADLRAEVADLALRAAGKVVGETMTDDRQRRLVKEFLDETADGTSSSKERSG